MDTKWWTDRRICYQQIGIAVLISTTCYFAQSNRTVSAMFEFVKHMNVYYFVVERRLQDCNVSNNILERFLVSIMGVLRFVLF